MRFFCIYASLSIFFIWLLHLTFYPALLALDEKRKRASRADCLCCITVQAMSSPDPSERHDGIALSVHVNNTFVQGMSEPCAIKVCLFALPNAACTWVCICACRRTLTQVRIARERIGDYHPSSLVFSHGSLCVQKWRKQMEQMAACTCTRQG